MKIIVLAGGLSTERDVSLTSGAGICKTLREKGHQAYLLDAFMGLPYDTGKLEEVFALPNAGLEIADGIKTTEPDLAKIKASRPDKSPCFLGPNVIELCRMADITFMGLHGDVGENGKLQAAFDILGIKYTGPNSLGSALAMDKGVTKQIFKMCNIPAPGGTWLKKTTTKTSLSTLGLSLPVVVKPCSGGSSIGVYIVHTDKEYQQALAESFRYEDELIIEPYIKGREFAVGIIDGEALPVIEIIPNTGFFDYANKYQDGCTQEICPADIEDSIAQKMQEAAVQAFHALKLDVYARADFLLTSSGDFFCLEVNSLPGMTAASLLPKEAHAAGIEYGDLCELIIAKSLPRFDF
ncbi:MAG: D-alanine--D-alanine ligase [Lachnospiraceae bacterium]